MRRKLIEDRFCANQGDYGWSPTYQDVLDLRRKYDAARAREKRKDELLAKALALCGCCDGVKWVDPEQACTYCASLRAEIAKMEEATNAG
jgi:hypothetical protein